MNVILPLAFDDQPMSMFFDTFCFHPEGVRGIIEDLIKIATSPDVEEAYNAYASQLIEEAEMSIYWRFLDNTMSPSDMTAEGKILSQLYAIMDIIVTTLRYFKIPTINTQVKIKNWVGNNDVLITL